MVLSSLIIEAQQLMSFDKLTVDDGLSNNSVYAITSDERGYMWFGTRNGLNRFDGHTFRKYDILKDGLQGNNVQSLYGHSNGELWIGLRTGGLAILDPKTEKVETGRFQGSNFFDLDNAFVRFIYKDSKERMWVATESRGIYCLKENGTISAVQYHIHAKKVEQRILNNDCFSISEDDQGRVWIGCTGGPLVYYDENQERFVEGEIKNIDSFPTFSDYRKIVKAGNGGLWIGAYGQGLYRLDFGTMELKVYDIGQPFISDIEIGLDGEILISTDGDGLFVSLDDGVSFKNIRKHGQSEYALNTNALYDIYIDVVGNIWVGSYNGGVNVYKKKKPPFYSFQINTKVQDVIESTSALCFEEDDNGVWVGLDGGGLVLLNKDYSVVKNYRIGDSVNGGICSDVITDLLLDSEGTIWMGTFENGLISFDPETESFKCFRYIDGDKNSINSNNVWSLEEDHYGRLWVGTLGGGLNLYDKKKEAFTNYLPNNESVNSLSGSNILDLLMGKDSTLWIGTEFGGLSKMNIHSLTFERIQYDPNTNNGLKSNVVRCLHEAEDGSIWIGTEGGGLHKLNVRNHEITNFNTTMGLPSDVIKSIESDSLNRLWVSTISGLSVFDPKLETFTNYSKGDGLQSDQFNPDASLKDADGRLYFGGINGITTFIPENIKINSIPPKVVLSEVVVYNHEGAVNVPIYGGTENDLQIVLNYWEKTIAIGYAALEFTNPDNHKHQYRLVGYESEWREVGSQDRRATYTNLDHGTYDFQVKAANNDGIWSDETTLVSFVIKPPFWETWWFIMLMIFIGGTTIIGIIIDREERRKEIHDKKLLVAEQEILALRNERLEETIEQKNSQLSAALLQSAHKNKSLENLKKELAELRASKSVDGSFDARSLRSLIRRIDEELDSEDYWKLFQMNFDEVHRQFSSRLQAEHPDLTTNELRLSSLIRIGMTNSEIAAVQGVSTSAVEKSKYRIKKKLNLDAETKLNQYLIAFQARQ